MVRKIDIKTKTMTIKYSIRKITLSLDDIIIPSRSKSPKMLRIIAMNDSCSVAYSLMYGPDACRRSRVTKRMKASERTRSTSADLSTLARSAIGGCARLRKCAAFKICAE